METADPRYMRSPSRAERSKAISIMPAPLEILSINFWRPLHASQFPWQLLRVNRTNERHIEVGLRTGQKFHFLRRAHNEPEHIGLSIVEHLTQLVWPNEDPAVLRDSQRLVAHTDSPYCFHDKIEFFRPDMFVERVGALRWQPPKPRSEVLALGSLKKIRVRDFHRVGGTPMEVFRRNQKNNLLSLSL